MLLVDIEPILPDVEESVRQEQFADGGRSKGVRDGVRGVRRREKRCRQPDIKKLSDSKEIEKVRIMHY